MASVGDMGQRGRLSMVLVFCAVVSSCSSVEINKIQGHKNHKFTKRAGDAGDGYGPYESYYTYPYYPQQGRGQDSRAYTSYGNGYVRRPVLTECRAYEPFRCPGGTQCISLTYLCDGAPDCDDGYDENIKLCTAAKRPPVDETSSFLHSLLASHGPNYLEKLFGSKARNRMAQMGGVNSVAIALSESQTIDEFGQTLHLLQSDIRHLRSVFMAVENGDITMLKSLGIKDSELGDVKFFLEKLVNTGFLD